MLQSKALPLVLNPSLRNVSWQILHLVYGRFFMLDPILSSDEVSGSLLVRPMEIDSPVGVIAQISIPESLYLSSEHLQESKLFLFENGKEMLIKVESLVMTVISLSEAAFEIDMCPSRCLQRRCKHSLASRR